MRGESSGPPDRWNHNIHYHPLILRAVPAGCPNALDVGCGEGMLARQLHAVVPRVTAIDLDEPSIDLARQQPSAGIEYLLGDVLTYPFEPASFDLIGSVAALHHMGTATGLERMRELLRPGGTLVVVGLARSQYPRDLAFDIAAVIGSRLLKRTKPYWEHSAPSVWPPPETYAETRDIATRLLPLVRYRRHVLFRYSLTWVKPPGDGK